MNRPDFSELVVALKGRSSKSVGFQPTKLGNFDGVCDRKAMDAWHVKMENYIHVAKVGRHSAVELTQSYLKGCASTWWRTMKQEEGKNHGYMWKFFKERIESEFIPKNYNYISRCKLREVMNVTNDNLHQYVKAYSELMLEIWHMHELDRVCHFVIGLPSLRKIGPPHYPRPSWKWKVSQMWDGGENSSSRRITSSLIRSHAMKGNGTKGKTPQKGKGPNNSKVRDSNPKEILSRRGLL